MPLCLNYVWQNASPNSFILKDWRLPPVVLLCFNCGYRSMSLGEYFKNKTENIYVASHRQFMRTCSKNNCVPICVYWLSGPSVVFHSFGRIVELSSTGEALILLIATYFSQCKSFSENITVISATLLLLQNSAISIYLSTF